MADVAVDAGDVPRFMRAAIPEHAIALRMARKASIVLLFHGIGRGLLESNRNGRGPARFRVCSPRAMAGFASQLFQVSARVRKCMTHDCVLEMFALISMAGEARIHANVI